MEIASTRIGESRKAFQVRQRNPELKREALLETAAHLFLERGYRKTSMNDLADTLSITKPALYHYFKNKEDILVGCYQHGISRIEARLKGAAGKTGLGVDKTRAFVHAYVDAVVSLDFGLCVATLDDGELSPDARDKVRKLKRRIDSSLRRFIEEGIADKTIQPCNSKLAAFAIAGAINGIGNWYDPGGPLQRSEIVENYTRLLVDGLSVFRNENPGKPKRTA